MHSSGISRVSPQHSRQARAGACAAAVALLVAAVALPVCSQSSAARPTARNISANSSDVYRPFQFDPAEMQMLDLVNRDRAAAGSQQETRGHALPLQWDPRLAAVARAHSEEMARNGYFSHQSLDGRQPDQRVSDARIPWLATGENIARASDVAQAEAMFMDEPKFQQNHRGNILNTRFTHIGVGVARGADGSVYVTQEFIQSR